MAIEPNRWGVVYNPKAGSWKTQKRWNEIRKYMEENGNKRIAKNTIILYIRMIVMMLISFYTTRVILEALGVDDYGINNVVGSLVSMFSLISSSLSSSTSRFITFGLGKGDLNELKKLYDISFSNFNL